MTTIIKNYCNHVNKDCKEETEITGALNFFEDLLGSRCRYSDKQEKVCLCLFLFFFFKVWKFVIKRIEKKTKQNIIDSHSFAACMLTVGCDFWVVQYNSITFACCSVQSKVPTNMLKKCLSSLTYRMLGSESEKAWLNNYKLWKKKKK